MANLGLDIEELLESGQADASAKNAQRDAHDRERRYADNDRYTRDGDGESDRRPRHTTSTPDRDRDDRMKDDDKASANGSDRSSRHANKYSGSRPYSERRPRDERPRDYRDRDNRRDGRYRSRSPRDDYYRPSRNDDRDRSYRRDRSRDRNDNRYDRRGGRDPPRGKPATPEPTDDEKDRRTVFVQQLAARLRSKELQQFFTAVGQVNAVQIVKDRVSGRSKGIGYVEFKDLESVQRAIDLTGQKLLGIPLIVSVTEAEKNRQAKQNVGAPTQSNGIPFHRLYVGNIHFSVTEDDLKEVFTPFGELEFVQLQRDETGRSRGYGFVQFVDPTDAKTALSEMNGFEIAGRPIRVGLGNDKANSESTAAMMQRFNGSQNNAASFQGSSFSGAGGRGTHNASFDRVAAADKAIGGASALDDSDVGGVNFHAFSRDSLMKKLARLDDAPDKNASRPNAVWKKFSAPSAAPSRCIIIRNAYNEAEETEPAWEKELEEDIRTECTKQYGEVVFVAVYTDSGDGEIYVKFKDLKGGDNALKGLNGRYFGGRTLTAQPLVDAIFNTTFPKAAKV